MTEVESKSNYEQAGLQIAPTDANEVLSPGALGAIAQAEAEVKAACAMAKRFPRDWDVVREKILKECRRPVFAVGREPGKGAIYSKPIGDTSIRGLSIRFAEAAISAAGHIHVTERTLSETEDNRKIAVKVWDAQSMVSFSTEITIEKSIERKSIKKGQEVLRTRLNSKGELLYIIRPTGDDLYVKEQAMKSKAIRNSGLRLMPSWLLDEARDVLEETIKAKDAQDPDQAKHQLLDAFAKVGVTVEHVKQYLGHDAGVLSPEELLQLRGLYTAIRDGETTIQAVFEELEAEKTPEKTKADSIREKLAGRSKSVKHSAPVSGPNVAPSSHNGQEQTTSLGLETAVGLLSGIIVKDGQKHIVLEGHGPFELHGEQLEASAKKRLKKEVVIHYQKEGSRRIVLAVENKE